MEGDLGWFCGNGSNNWDLHAVVRFACTGSGRVALQSASNDTFSWLNTPSALESSSGLPQPQPHADQLMDADAATASQPILAEPAIDDLCLQAFFVSPKPATPQPSSPTNVAPPSDMSPADGAPGKPRTSDRAGGGGPIRSKRKSKKSQVSKAVTRVPVGGPPADLWAWRKYGQKPIKGSPYPRGYYRCSTDKDCTARKQVERCRSDPGTLIVTYTGDHSHPVPLHRNSLAGTTRNKVQPPPPSPSKAEDAPKPEAALSTASAATDTTKSQGSSCASTGLSTSTPLRLRSPSLGLGVEYKDDDAVPVRMLLEGADMEGEDDMLLALPLAGQDRSVSGHGSCCEDVMLFPKLDEAPATASTGRTMDGCAEAPIMNIDIAARTNSLSRASRHPWQAAAVVATSSWG